MLNKKQKAALVAVGLVFGLILTPAGIALAGFLDDSYRATGNVPYSANNGPTIELGEDSDVKSGNPFPDSNTVQLNTSNGNITFSSTGSTEARVTNINGTWTNVTNVDASSNALTINPDDKEEATVSGNLDSFEYRANPTINEGEKAFGYSGASGTTTVTLNNVPQGETYIAIDIDTRDILAAGTADSNGQVTFTSMPNSQHDVELQTSDGEPTLKNPSPEGAQNNFPTTLSVDVEDPDFPDENVTVEFYLDDTKVGEDHVTSNGGTASVSISSPSRGSHDVSAQANDSFGQETERNWTFSVPENLTIRDQTDPYDIIDDRQVNITFYEGDDIFEASTTNGNVSLEDLPVEGQIVAEVEANQYHTAFVTIDDITKQNTIYLLNTSEATYEVAFELDDQTGGTFSDNNASLKIQKPINRSDFSEPKWSTIHADQFGVDGVITELEQDQRYRLIVSNDVGDKRVLGTYTASQSETRTLTVGQVEAIPGDEDADFAWSADYVNSSSGEFVKFSYNDTEMETDSVTVKIYERGNESNVLLSNQTFGGPLGTFSISEKVPSDQQDNDWVAEAWVERGDETIKIVEPVGPQRPILGDMPDWLVAMISIGSIIIIGGLFSQLNGAIGGLVVAGFGGMLWYVDFIPGVLGTGVVILAMIVAGVIFINERRSQSL